MIIISVVAGCYDIYDPEAQGNAVRCMTLTTDLAESLKRWLAQMPA